MITKMTKYSFILMTEEKEGFLEQLQELGVVDISRSVKPVDQDSSEMFAKASRAKKAIEFIESVNYSKDVDAEEIARSTVNVEGDPVDFIESCRTKIGELNTSLANAEKQMKARLPWGDYDRKAVEGLKELGYNVRYYCVDSKRFDEKWGELQPLQVIADDGSKVWFVTVSPKDGEYTFPVQEIPAPEGTYAEAATEAERIRKEHRRKSVEREVNQ